MNEYVKQMWAHNSTAWAFVQRQHEREMEAAKEQRLKDEKAAEKARKKRAKKVKKAHDAAEANRVYWRLGPNGLEQISK
jgi:hypothetical protein